MSYTPGGGGGVLNQGLRVHVIGEVFLQKISLGVEIL